jgi:hypothetical protein
MKVKKRTKLLILISGFLLFPFLSDAASLYFLPQRAQYGKGDVFKIDLMLDTKGEPINTCEAKVYFDNSHLEIVDIAKGGSLMTLWAKDPKYSKEEGAIVLIGGVPGGFNGEGKLISIIFRAVMPGPTILSLKDGSKVLLNDGKGTSAMLEKKDATIEISSSPTVQPSDDWQEEIRKDKTMPERFKIKIGQDPAVFEGKYFIVFSTVDNQTGIAFYQVKEGDSGWKTGESPYLLESQDLKGKILVRAVDKAGNERIEEYSQKDQVFYVEIIAFLIIIFSSTILFLKKFKLKKS